VSINPGSAGKAAGFSQAQRRRAAKAVQPVQPPALAAPVQAASGPAR